MHIIAGKAVAFKEAMEPPWKKMQKQIVVNAKTLAGRLIKDDFNLVSGGTDNHLMLADLTNKALTGKEAEAHLGEAAITLNKNTVPYDKQSPFITSGIRIGTPCVTMRGMQEEQMKSIGGWINDVIAKPSKTVKDRVMGEVEALCDEYPIYRTWLL